MQVDLRALADEVRKLSGADRKACLIADQRCRWQRGETLPVEAYLAGFPDLQTEDRLDLIYNEIVLREELGNAFSFEEYSERFPQHREALQRQLALHQALGEEASQAGIGQATTDRPAESVHHAPATCGNVELPQTVDLGPGWAWPKVPDYEMLNELGRGGMGVVYMARQVALRRIVALKMILSGTGASDVELARFRREAESVARLQHPCIVQIYEIGEHDGRPYFSLEFIDGGSLAQELKDSLPTPRAAAERMVRLADAIQAAHEQGIIHRDLKPANILLTRDGSPKITDFGLAKNLDEDLGDTRTGQIMGTPSYMAPEQASGQIDRIGPCTDIYSLGALLYEMLTGRPPFKGTTILDILSQVRNREPIAPRRVQPKVPYDLETICLRCLQKDPRKRYASARDLATDLQHYLDGKPIQARRTPLWERTAKYVRRNPWVASFWVLLVVSLLAAGTWGVNAIYQRLHHAELFVETQSALLKVQQEIERQQQQVWEKRDWQEATTQWSRVDGMIRQQPALAPLQEYASSLEQAIQQGKEDQQTEREKSRAARDTHQRFLRAANRAMIHQLPNIGTRQHSNLQVVREEAPQALACYGVTLATRGRPDTDNPYLTEAERDSIVPGCYELLLAWAHATAHPVRDKGEDDFVQARKALEILDRAAQLGLDTRAYHMRRRTYLLITGDKEGAAGEFALARKMEAKTATDNYLVGAELYATVPALAEPARTQAHRQAIQHLQRAVDLRPDHYWANFELGRIYLHAGRLDAGVARLTACIQQSDFAWAYSLRAHANATLNLYDAAELDFASAEKQGDDEVRYGVLVNRGVMYFQRGEQAQADTKQVQHWLDRARREYERAIALAPDQYQAYVNLARLWQFQGQLDLALENLDRAIELRGSDSSLLRTRALLQLKRRQEDAALDDLERAVATAPALKSTNLASDHLERGRILYRKRRYQDALEAFETAQRMHPEEFPSAHRLRAEALLELGRHSEALLAINRYLTRGGEADHDAYLTRGLIRTKLSRFREAIDDFTLALAAPLAKVTEGQADKIRAQTFSYRGWAYLLLNAVEVAEGDFDQAVKLDSQNGDAYSGRGNARVKQGKHEEALADIETSLRLGPASSRLSYNAARTYALAVDAVSKNAAFDRQKLSQAQFYQSRAIDLLRESLDQVPAAERAIYWKDFIDTDPALQAVRRSPRFAQLQATLR